MNEKLSVWSKEWWKAAGIRAAKTFAQTMIATLAASMGFEDVDWLRILSVSGLAALLSLLTSIAGLPEIDKSQIKE